MRLSRLSWCNILSAIGVTVFCFFGSFFILSFGVLSRTSMAATDVNPNVELRNGPFQISSPTLNPFNRELWLNSRVKLAMPGNYSGTIFPLCYIKTKLYFAPSPRYIENVGGRYRG